MVKLWKEPDFVELDLIHFCGEGAFVFVLSFFFLSRHLDKLSTFWVHDVWCQRQANETIL